MNITDRLDEIQARADNATDGPWDAAQGESPEGGRVSQVAAPAEPSGMGFDFLPILATLCTAEDAEFMAHARTDVPALVAALRGVLAYVDDCEGDYLMHADDIRDLIADMLGVPHQ